MNHQQMNEIGIRLEILEVIARAYRHSAVLPKIKKLKKSKDYQSAISTIHKIETDLKSKKHDSFRKKLRKKFRKRKPIKRKKR